MNDGSNNVETDVVKLLKTVLDQQQIILHNQQTMVLNQRTIAKEVLTIKQGVQELYKRNMNFENRPTPQPPAVVETNMTSSFVKLVDEQSLNSFEAQIQDANYRLQLIDSLLASIGKNHRDLSSRNIALQVEAKLMKGEFWTTTAWTGGRSVSEDGQKKFSFSAHSAFISFFS